MIALLTLTALVSYCLIILIQNEKHVYLRDRKGRFTAKVTRRTAKKIDWVGGEQRIKSWKGYTYAKNI